MEAAFPQLLWLIHEIASLKFFALITFAIGPKISSLVMLILFSIDLSMKKFLKESR